jgi:protein-tyrosine phosphatase
MSSPAGRRLIWPDCRNVRDLGGLPAAGGAHIRDRALIRADSLDRLSPESLKLLEDEPISLILDLRNAGEGGNRRHPFEGDPRYRPMPLIDPRRERVREERAKRTLGAIYSSGLDRNARCIVDIMAAIADAPEGAVVVHCAVGKDRTGMIVALTLSAAGVPDEVIAEDYAFSAECLREEFDAFLSGFEGAELAHLAERMSAEPATILQMLAHARENYGGVEEYLLAKGLGADRLERLRKRLT